MVKKCLFVFLCFNIFSLVGSEQQSANALIAFMIAHCSKDPSTNQIVVGSNEQQCEFGAGVIFSKNASAVDFTELSNKPIRDFLTAFETLETGAEWQCAYGQSVTFKVERKGYGALIGAFLDSTGRNIHIQEVRRRVR